MPAAPPNSPTSTRGRNSPSRCAVALERRETGRRLVAEGDRHRLLQVAAPRHRRVAVALGEAGERIGDRHDVGLDEVERLADLQDGRGVGDVLGGGAPMAPFAEAVAAQADELLHHRQHRIADPLGLRLQLGEVEFLASQCRQISSAASCGMMPSRAWTRASAASMSRYFWTRFSSAKMRRIGAVEKISRKIPELTPTAVIVEPFSGGGTAKLRLPETSSTVHARSPRRRWHMTGLNV